MNLALPIKQICGAFHCGLINMPMERVQYYLYSLHLCSEWSMDHTQEHALNI